MRVAIFFDGKNFNQGWKKCTASRKIDLSLLAGWIVEQARGDLFWGAYYYTGEERGLAADSEGQKGLRLFLDAVELLPGFFVHRYPRKAMSRTCSHCGRENRFTTEKEVDTNMVADMLRLAAVNAFDIAVLVSGDADHAPAVEGVRALGKQVFVATWGGIGLAPRIRRAAFDHIDLMRGLEIFGLADRRGEPEPALEASVGTSSPGCPSPPPITAKQAMISALAAAEDYFRGRFVGVSYFLNRWSHEGLDSNPDVRARLLNELRADGMVEVYDAPNGDKALRRSVP